MKMTTRSQNRKAVADLPPGEFEVSATENSQPQNLVAGPSKSPKIQPEKLIEIKTSLRKGIMSDINKIVADNQREMLKLIGPTVKKRTFPQNLEDSDSETEKKQNASGIYISSYKTNRDHF